MSRNLSFKYDAESDVMYIDACEPYAEQDSRSIAEGVVARVNPDTDVVENLEILFFSKRTESGADFQLPLSATLRLLAS